CRPCSARGRRLPSGAPARVSRAPPAIGSRWRRSLAGWAWSLPLSLEAVSGRSRDKQPLRPRPVARKLMTRADRVQIPCHHAFRRVPQVRSADRSALHRFGPAARAPASIRGRMRRPMDSFRIDEIARRLLERVPPALRSMQQDLESNFRAVLRERLSKLDLVSRDEFDAQTRVLERTRARLEALEARRAALEGGGSAAA